jgi:hypothetical protein
MIKQINTVTFDITKASSAIAAASFKLINQHRLAKEKNKIPVINVDKVAILAIWICITCPPNQYKFSCHTSDILCSALLYLPCKNLYDLL